MRWPALALLVAVTGCPEDHEDPVEVEVAEEHWDTFTNATESLAVGADGAVLVAAVSSPEPSTRQVALSFRLSATWSGPGRFGAAVCSLRTGESETSFGLAALDDDGDDQRAERFELPCNGPCELAAELDCVRNDDNPGALTVVAEVWASSKGWDPDGVANPRVEVRVEEVNP
ncbi:MAG: hypothetical protein KJO07_25435 [Deltaproteobacteria bacterium]|nr:hypothetical protein [Deltaproteobacteria bacterium]